MTGTPRLKFLQVDIMVGIAALDIVINKAPRTTAYNYSIGTWLLRKLKERVTKSFIRLSKVEARNVMQAIRLALNAVGNRQMEAEARSTLERLERFCNDT